MSAFFRLSIAFSGFWILSAVFLTNSCGDQKKHEQGQQVVVKPEATETPKPTVTPSPSPTLPPNTVQINLNDKCYDQINGFLSVMGIKDFQTFLNDNKDLVSKYIKTLTGTTTDLSPAFIDLAIVLLKSASCKELLAKAGGLSGLIGGLVKTGTPTPTPTPTP